MYALPHNECHGGYSQALKRRTFPSSVLFILTGILMLMSVARSNAQQCNWAGFDVDANLYSGVPVNANSDDWFQGTSGEGIMDPAEFLQYGPYPILSNIAFKSNVMTIPP
jgi:hypothetical protein